MAEFSGTVSVAGTLDPLWLGLTEEQVEKLPEDVQEKGIRPFCIQEDPITSVKSVVITMLLCQYKGESTSPFLTTCLVRRLMSFIPKENDGTRVHEKYVALTDMVCKSGVFGRIRAVWKFHVIKKGEVVVPHICRRSTGFFAVNATDPETGRTYPGSAHFKRKDFPLLFEWNAFPLHERAASLSLGKAEEVLAVVKGSKWITVGEAVARFTKFRDAELRMIRDKGDNYSIPLAEYRRLSEENLKFPSPFDLKSE